MPTERRHLSFITTALAAAAVVAAASASAPARAADEPAAGEPAAEAAHEPAAAVERADAAGGLVDAAPARRARSPFDAERDRYRAATDPSERLRLGRDLLLGLDAAGEGRSADAASVVNELLGLEPGDAQLLWRRADTRRRIDDAEGAIEDLERLARDHAGAPLGIRARRALPSLYLRTGRREQAAQADELLLRDGVADPSAVLVRLARTYTLLEDVPRAREALRRLEQAAPERLRLDRELAWLAADAADRAGTREEAAAALVRFANLFPRDPRRPEALLRAARAFQAQGLQATALTFMEASVEAARSPNVEVAGRLGRGEVLQEIGDRRKARDEYRNVFEAAKDATTAGQALARVVDLTVEIEGRDRALLMLAARIASGERFAAEAGRKEFARIVADMGDDLARDGAQALFVRELARRAGCENALPPAVDLAAGGVFESVGAYERAAALYKPVADHDGSAREPALAGLRRARPREVPPGTPQGDPGRLAALRREEAWPLLLRAIGATDKPDAGARTLGARAAFMAGDFTWAQELLEPLGPRATEEPALLRADARALAGDWDAACKDYRGAAGPALGAAAAAWLDVRLAACEWRDGRDAEARARLQAVLARHPGEPSQLAAELLLARLPAAPDAAAPGASGAGGARPVTR